MWCDPPDSVPEDYVTYGKWLVFKPLSKLDETWHMIRREVKTGRFGDGCTGAKCSTVCELDKKTNPSRGVCIVYTTRESMDDVGLKLIHKVEQTIR